MSSHSAPECELDVADVLRRKLLCIPDYPKPGGARAAASPRRMPRAAPAERAAVMFLE